MQFLLILHADLDPWVHPMIYNSDEARRHPRALLDSRYREFTAVMHETSQTGEFRAAAALGDPAAARVVNWGPDGPSVTTGLSSDDAAVGVLECESIERAAQIAARMAHPGCRVEVRPVEWSSGWE